jgi:hypothetical protein
MMDKMQIGRGEQRLLEPRTGWSRMAQLIDAAVEGVVIASGPGELTEQIETLRVDFAAFSAEQGKN